MIERETLQTEQGASERRDALLERLNEAGTSMMELCLVYIGDRLGLYRALAEHGAMTSHQLGAQTGTTERYIREWLEAQTVAGVLECANSDGEPADRRFVLPPGHEEALADSTSLSYWAPQSRFFVSLVPTLPALLDAFC